MQSKSRYHLIKVLRMRGKAEGHRVSLASIGKAAKVAAATITKIEEGQIKKPRPEILNRIAKYFSQIFDEPISANDLADPNYKDSAYEEVLLDYIAKNLPERSATSVRNLKNSVIEKPYTNLTINQGSPNREEKPEQLYTDLSINPTSSEYSVNQDQSNSDFSVGSKYKLDILTPPQLVSIPVLKDISSGNLDSVTEEQVIERLLFLSSHLGGAKFAIYATGDSMVPEIKHGDLILIDPTVEPQDGDTIIAIVEGQITCRIIRSTNQQLLLMPANSDLNPTVVSDQTPVDIIGKVVKQIRNYQ